MDYKENIAKNKFLNLISILSVSQAFWILSFTFLTAIASQITIPIKPVPFTLQTMVVVLSGAFLGAKKGFYSQVIYLLAGCLGLPVFAQVPDATIGFARLFGPTGGYLLAFPAAAFEIFTLEATVSMRSAFVINHLLVMKDYNNA